MSSTNVLTHGPPTLPELALLEDVVEERRQEQHLMLALSRLRALRRMRHRRTSALARREHELRFERMLLVTGLTHLR